MLQAHRPHLYGTLYDELRHAGTSSAPARVLISVATYNERDNLSRLLVEVKRFAPDADVLVVDDNSPDGTGQVADRWAAGHRWVRVLHRSAKLGHGTAMLRAIEYALEHDYDLLLNMDADFSHHPRYVPALLAGMDRHDVMIGSRYTPGGGTVNWPFSRRLMSRSVNLLVRFLMGLSARDCSGAFRCYRLTKLRQAGLDRIVSRGYSFQQELLLRCHQSGCTIGETPIVFENRRAGASKVDIREAVRSLATLLWLGSLARLGLRGAKIGSRRAIHHGRVSADNPHQARAVSPAGTRS